MSLSPARPVPTGVHSVRQGESLWRIALAYDTHVAELVRLNGFRDADVELFVGQALRVPARGGPPRASAAGVEAGQVVATVDGTPRPLGPGAPLPAPVITDDGRYVVWCAEVAPDARQLMVWDANTARSRGFPLELGGLERVRVQPTSDHQTALVLEGTAGEPPLPVVAVYSPATGFAWGGELPATVESLEGDLLTVRYQASPGGFEPFPGAETEALDLRGLLRG